MAESLPARGLLLGGCLLSALFALAFNLLPVTLGSAADHFQLQAREIGYLGSSLLAGWVLGSSLTFVLVARFNWRQIVAGGITLACAGYLASTQVNSIAHINLCWFVAGFGAGLPFSIAIQALATLGNQEQVMGIKLTSEVLLGAALLYLFPILLIDRWGYTGAAIGMAAALAAGFFVLRLVPSGPITVGAATTHHAGVSWRDNLPAIVALIVLGIFFGGQSGIWAFVERIGNEIGLSAGDIGFSLAMVKVMGGLAGATAALLGARFGVRWPHLLGLASIAGGLYLIHGSTSLWPYAVGSWIWEFGFALLQCYQMAAVAILDRSGRMAALIPAGMGVGAALGPAIAGNLKTGDSYAPVLVFAVACCLLSTVVFSVLARRQLNSSQVPGPPRAGSSLYILGQIHRKLADCFVKSYEEHRTLRLIALLRNPYEWK